MGRALAGIATGLFACFCVASELIVTGTNHSSKPQIVVTRIDDRPELSYVERFNGEHWVLPGEFRISQPLSDLRAVNGRPINAPYTMVKAFSPSTMVRISNQTINDSHSRMNLIIGYDFGNKAHIEPGFDAWPGDQYPTVDRGRSQTNADPLTRDGVRAHNLELDLAGGEYWIALWLDEPGEWEWVPRFLERTVMLDSVALLDQTMTAKTWRSDYATPARDYQRVIAAIAQPTVLHRVRVGAKPRLTIQSDHPDGRFIAGIAVARDRETLDNLIERRADQITQRWPLFETSKRARFSLLRSSNQVAVDEWRFYELPPNIDLQIGDDLQARVYSREKNLRRHHLAGNLLTFSLDTLTPSSRVGNHGGVLAIKATRPGTFPIKVGPTNHHFNSMQVDRPSAKPVGLFWEPPVWMTQQPSADAHLLQWACDQQHLSEWGLSILAPSFPTPLTPESATRFARQQPNGAVSYAEWRRLSDHPDQAEIVDTLIANNLPITIMDEPSNTEMVVQDLAEIRAVYPELKLAGFLNHPGDQRWLSQLDRAYLNNGFGLDYAKLQKLDQPQLELWLYNLDHPRWGAGLGLLHPSLDGAIFWHARLPTGRPDTPLDGRETDISWLGNPNELCGDAPIQSELLKLVQGVEDQRWALWAKRNDFPVTNSFDEARLESWRDHLLTRIAHQ